MNQLKSLVRHVRARGIKLAMTAAAAAAVIAVALTIFSSTPPHAEAQPPRPPDTDQFSFGVFMLFDEWASAEADEHVVFTVSSSQPDCWIGSPTVRERINEAQSSGFQINVDLARVESDGNTACTEYTLTWPRNEEGPWARWERYDSSNPPNKRAWTGGYTELITASNCDFCEFLARYRLAAISRFEPQLAISVPATPADGFVGETFAVMIERVGTDTNCTASATANYIVEAGSNVAVPDGDLPLLVHDADTADDANTTCSYTATFPSQRTVMHGDGTMTMLTTDTLTATITDPTEVTRTYAEPSEPPAEPSEPPAEPSEPPSGPAEPPAEQTTFVTDFAVRVPYVDPGNHGDNELGDITISVTYVPASGAAAACTEMTEEFTISRTGGFSSGGWVPPPDPRTQLVNTPMNSSTPCRYVANFADSFTHGTHGTFNIALGDMVEFDASDFADGGFLTVAYSNDTVFLPIVEISVPQINDATDDPATEEVETTQNFFRDAVFRVTIAPTDDSPDGCSSSNTGAASHTVEFDGVVSQGRNNEGVRGLFLVDVPMGAAPGERCAYTVTFPASAETALTANTFTLERVSMATEARIDADFPYAFREYRRPAAEVSRMLVDVFLLGGAADTVWEFAIAPASGAPDHCTPAHRWRATAEASTQVQTGTRLVRRPLDAGTDCSYTLTWPTSEVGGMAYRRVAAQQSMTTATLTPSNSEATANYELAMPVPFTPSIAVSVPQLDGLTAGVNIWAGETFDVTIAQAAAVSGCDADPALVVTYTVQTNGSVTTTDPDLPSSLTGTTAGGDACEYAVSFSAPPTAGASDELGWELTAPGDDTLSGSSTSASGVYSVGEVTFDPDASITVPSGHTGKRFSVDFTSTPAGCVDRTLVFEVGAGVAVEPASTNPALVAYPAGATASSELCSYAVTFGSTEVGGATLTLEPGSTTTVTGRSQAISATYVAQLVAPGATPFTPSIVVSVPQLDGLTAGVNIWAGATFDVTIAQASPVSGCNAEPPLVVTYTVQPVGSVTTTDPDLPTMLTGTTAGGDVCEYAVGISAPPTAGPSDELAWELMVMTAPEDDTLSGSSTSASVVYSVGEVTFDPDASITVPSGHTGKRFSVDFTSTQVGCVDRTLVFEVGAGVAVEPASTNMALVAYPAGAASSSELCSYAYEFPMNELNGATLALQPGSTTTVTGTSQAISATYAAAPPDNTPPQNTTPPPAARQPSGGGGRSGGGGGGRTSGGGGSSTPRETGPFVPSATQRVPVGVSLTLPADVFVEPTPIEVLINVPDECGTDVRTFEGLAASVGLVYAFDASSGATADIIAAGARQIAAFAERGTTQRPCALRVTLLSAPAGCTLGAAGTDPADGSAASTDDAGRSYVELATGDDAAALNLTPALTCA